jgi:hypothetical protein
LTSLAGIVIKVLLTRSKRNNVRPVCSGCQLHQTQCHYAYEPVEEERELLPILRRRSHSNEMQVLTRPRKEGVLSAVEMAGLLRPGNREVHPDARSKPLAGSLRTTASCYASHNADRCESATIPERIIEASHTNHDQTTFRTETRPRLTGRSSPSVNRYARERSLHISGPHDLTDQIAKLVDRSNSEHFALEKGVPSRAVMKRRREDLPSFKEFCHTVSK